MNLTTFAQQGPFGIARSEAPTTYSVFPKHEPITPHQALVLVEGHFTETLGPTAKDAQVAKQYCDAISAHVSGSHSPSSTEALIQYLDEVRGEILRCQSSFSLR